MLKKRSVTLDIELANGKTGREAWDKASSSLLAHLGRKQVTNGWECLSR